MSKDNDGNDNQRNVFFGTDVDDQSVIRRRMSMDDDVNGDKQKITLLVHFQWDTKITSTFVLSYMIG